MSEEFSVPDFTLGTIIGIVLSVFSALLLFWKQREASRCAIKTVCLDLIENISRIIDDLEENRARNRVIDHEFLDLIEVELTVFGRTREHTAILSDSVLRKSIRDFFVKIAIFRVRINLALASFSKLHQAALEPSISPEQRTQYTTESHHRLAQANQLCDQLREYKNNTAASLVPKLKC
jgi:hypothetical protein